MLTSIRNRVAGFAGVTTGTATLEFVVLAPFVFYFIFSIAEAGVLMTRTVMLDRGVDIAIRDLRLGLNPGITHDGLKQKICEHAFLLGGCNEGLLLEVTPVTNAANFPAGQANCIDRTGQVAPTIRFTPGARSEIVFVRACVVVDPIFPGIGLAAMLPSDGSGGHAIVVQTAFMNEPT